MALFGTTETRPFATLFGPTSTDPHPFGDYGLALVPYSPTFLTDLTITLILDSGKSRSLLTVTGTSLTSIANDGHTTTLEI